MAMAAFKIADWVLLDEVSVHLKQNNGGSEDLARLDIQAALDEGCRSLLRWVKDGQEVREYPPPAFWRRPSTRLVWDRLPRRLCVRLPQDEHKGDVLYTFLLRTDAARWGLLPALESSQAKQQSKQQRQQQPKKREPAPADAQPQPRASRRRRSQRSGPQTLRARVVLKRMYGGPEEYPTRDEVSDVDLLDRFAKEYEKVEGKANPPSRLRMPSPATVLREVGRKD